MLFRDISTKRYQLKQYATSLSRVLAQLVVPMIDDRAANTLGIQTSQPLIVLQHQLQRREAAATWCSDMDVLSSDEWSLVFAGVLLG